jgi:hypothetical protein
VCDWPFTKISGPKWPSDSPAASTVSTKTIPASHFVLLHQAGMSATRSFQKFAV